MVTVLVKVQIEVRVCGGLMYGLGSGEMNALWEY